MTTTLRTWRRPCPTWLAVAFAFGFLAGPASAQDKGTVDAKPLPPLANPDDPNTPAKALFGRRPTPAPLATRVIGFYSKGCLAGAKALPINGKTWQVMRLSRNRNWGHPNLVTLLERLSAKGAKLGWRGLMVGDMSQPRGGPMLTGHASHQVGLDADIWLTPMPNRELTRKEREELSATMVVARGPQGRRSERLDARARRDHQGGRAGAAGRAHLRQRGDQEGALPRGRQRSRLAAQGAALLGPRLSLSHSHQVSGRQTAIASRKGPRQPATAAARNSITGSPRRSCTRSRRPFRRKAAAAAQDGRPAGGLPPGAARAVDTPA